MIMMVAMIIMMIIMVILMMIMTKITKKQQPVTRSPIELLWTAKNHHQNFLNQGFLKAGGPPFGNIFEISLNFFMRVYIIPL